MKSKVEFYVIYTIDIPINADFTRDVHLCHCLPDTIKEDMKRKRKHRKVWQLAECETFDILGTGTLCMHRKYVGTLDASTFKQFCEDVGFVSACDTMGILDYLEHIPAISLESENHYDGYRDNAYVSPLLDVDAIKADFKEMSEGQIKAISEVALRPLGDKLMQALRDIADCSYGRGQEGGEEMAWKVLEAEHTVNLINKGTL